MRRILALVCIFILLLFTGMPMFTSNLLCNETRVYADTPQISDNEKIRAAITVYLNSKGAYLSSQGLQMNVVMSLMQSEIDSFINTGVYVGGILYDTASLVLDIGVTTSPLTVILKAGAVSFFNQFLQWLIDEGKITANQDPNDLYEGYMLNNHLFAVISGNFGSNHRGECTDCKIGNPWNGYDYNYFKDLYNTQNNITVDYSQYVSGTNYGSYFSTTLNLPQQNTNDTSPNRNITLRLYNQDAQRDYRPLLGNTDVTNQNIALGKIYGVRGASILGGVYLVKVNDTNLAPYIAAGIITYNSATRKYYFSAIRIYSSGNPEGSTSANISFNKNNFDSTPTQEPVSDGLTYQPRQTGTGNTYNTYNDYYQDWHEGDTYIYYPSDGGGGDEPGGGGEDPTPGGTTPPWDGSGSEGLYSQGGTLTPDGNGGYNLNFPDVGLPDLNIDWSINGLKEKFPFSIPWDLMAFFAVMNAEPETPEIQATIPLGLWEWDIDWDLHAFDNVARILRNMELIGFCIGLILITRSIIKG